MNNEKFHRQHTTSRRWLILGAAGQLGREWCDYLENRGADYHGFTRDQLDICSDKQMEKTLDEIRPDVVINCAAYTKVDDAEDERATVERINVFAVRNLARLCAARRVPLVHYSTDYVFPGSTEHRTKFPNGYPESFPPDPVNFYGESKWRSEQVIMEAGGPHLILRVSWLCGKYGHNFVRTMLRLSDERDHLKIVNDQFGCPAFTHPVVANTHVLVEQGVTGTIHMTSEGVTTWYEFAREVFNIKGIKTEVTAIPTSDFPTRAIRPSWSRLDIKTLSDIPGTRILPWRQHLEQLLQDIP